VKKESCQASSPVNTGCCLPAGPSVVVNRFYRESESVRVGQTFEITNLHKNGGPGGQLLANAPIILLACPFVCLFAFPHPQAPTPRASYQAGRASHHQSSNPLIQRQAPKSHQVAVGSTFENTFRPCWCPLTGDVAHPGRDPRASQPEKGSAIFCISLL